MPASDSHGNTPKEVTEGKSQVRSLSRLGTCLGADFAWVRSRETQYLEGQIHDCGFVHVL